jgi:hypothetical protein
VIRESDTAAIDELMSKFLGAVSFEQGGQPSYGDLPDLFVPDARLIRNSGSPPEISSVDEFVRARQDAVDAGELTSFEETELSETTELFGNIAHRFSPYRKRGVTDRGRNDVRGAISTQFIRTAGRLANQLDGLGRRAARSSAHPAVATRVPAVSDSARPA